MRSVNGSRIPPGLSTYGNFAEAAAANPVPSIGMHAAIDGGGVVVWTAAGWYGDLGYFATPATLPAVAITAPGCWTMVGDFGLGTGGLARREGSRWAVAPGEAVYRAVDPLSVVSAAAAGQTFINLPAIPVGLIGDGEMWELVCPSETAVSGQTGNDGHYVYVGAALAQVSGATPVSNQRVSGVVRLLRYGNTLRNLFSGSTTNAGSMQNIAHDFTTALPWRISINSANIGNSSYFRRAEFRRVS